MRGLFTADVQAAQRVGKEYVLGETNSVSGGGAAGVSPTFGAALWTMDYILLATATNISRIYFHQGTVGNCQYCFFGRYSMGAPYYGAYAATAFMAGMKYIAPLDNGSNNFAADGNVARLLLYNSNYYESGSRSREGFTLTGLPVGDGVRVRFKRLTAKGATARQDKGDEITFGGQRFTDGTCVVSGSERFEEVVVQGGRATIEVQATEAVVVYLK